MDTEYPCVRHYDPAGDKKSEPNWNEWKTYGIPALLQLRVHLPTPGLHINVSYSINDYTSLAHDWQSVAPNRVFSPHYIDTYLNDLIKMPYKQLEVFYDSW